jgi:hypothetical protein
MKILHSLAAGLLSATSILARRVAFPLLLLGAGLVLVQPCAGDSGILSYTGSLVAARGLHTATLLPNGQVLVAGRYNGSFEQRVIFDRCARRLQACRCEWDHRNVPGACAQSIL